MTPVDPSGPLHRLARWSLRHPRATLLLAALASLVALVGVLRLESRVGYRAFLGERHPEVAALDAHAERFGGGIPLAAVWRCAGSAPCRSVFDPASLRMAHDVARALEATPGVARVDGIATTPLLMPQAIGFPEARRLAPQGEAARDLDELAARALADPVWRGQLVSPDGRTGAVIAQLESSDGDLARDAVEALQATLAPFEESGFRFHLVGGPVEFVVAGAELERATARMVPVMVALIALALLLLFRAWLGALLALATVGIAVLWTLGGLGLSGWGQNSLTQALAPLVLVIGVCDVIHLVAAYLAVPGIVAAASRAQREAALLQACGEVGRACWITTVTTAAGFASFAVSGLESVARFGTVAAFGVCAALLIGFSVLPVVLVRVPAARLERSGSAARWRRFLLSLTRISVDRSRLVMIAAGVAAAIGLAGVARLHVDASFEDLYGRESRVVRWADFVREHLREPDTLELALTPPAGAALSDPAVLAVVADVQQRLGSLDGLGRALSIVDPLRVAHRLFYPGELDPKPSPANAERSAALFRNLRAEDRAGFRLFVDEEGRGLRVTVASEKLPQDRLRVLLADVHATLSDGLPPGWNVAVSGPLQVVRVMVDELRRTQLVSFALTGAIVALLAGVFFRSPLYAAMAMVPTLLPVLFTLGVMGLAGIALDVGGAMVAAVVIGLAVDDAVHLLVSYQRGRQEGASPAEAVVRAVGRVGRALVTTSLALAVGFVSLMLSPWRSVANFGLIAGIAMLAALLSALVILPALVVSADRMKSGRSGG